MMKQIAAIVAIARDGAIGRQGGLLCHLPADLKHFKSLTMGHTVVMGRRTFESLPHGPLPGRENIVVTHNRYYHPQNVVVVHSVEEAVEAATLPGEVFVIGGAQIYADFGDADTFFPSINAAEWTEVDREHHAADERNPYDYDFVTLNRKQ